MTSPVSLTYFTVTGDFFAVADPAISGVLNSPVLAPVNPSTGPPGLVTFTPRLGKGRMIPITNYLVQAAYNAEQTVNIVGNPTGGTFTLAYGTDAPITLAWNVSPSAMQTALNASPSVAAAGGGVLVLADPQPFAYDVEFTGGLGGTTVPLLVADGADLTTAQGVGFCEVVITPTSTGGPQIVADTAIAIAPLTAGIVDGVLCTIDPSDTPGLELTSNSAALGLGVDLIYDVTFTNIIYNNTAGTLASFAFTAPTDSSPVCITDPTLVRLAWQPPSQTMYVPPGTGALQLQPLSWRARAGI
jgi:hypothetical protein